MSKLGGTIHQSWFGSRFMASSFTFFDSDNTFDGNNAAPFSCSEVFSCPQRCLWIQSTVSQSR